MGTRRVVAPNLRAKPGPIAASSRSFSGLTLRCGSAASWSDGSAAHGQTTLDPARKFLASATKRTSNGTPAMR
jgi:hypothetical protein